MEQRFQAKLKHPFVRSSQSVEYSGLDSNPDHDQFDQVVQDGKASRHLEENMRRSMVPMSLLEEAHLAILNAHKELGAAQTICVKLLSKSRKQSTQLSSQAKEMSDMKIDLRTRRTELFQLKLENDILERQVAAKGELNTRLQATLLKLKETNPSHFASIQEKLASESTSTSAGNEKAQYLERAIQAENDLAEYKRARATRGARLVLSVWFSKVQYWSTHATDHAFQEWKRYTMKYPKHLNKSSTTTALGLSSRSKGKSARPSVQDLAELGIHEMVSEDLDYAMNESKVETEDKEDKSNKHAAVTDQTDQTDQHRSAPSSSPHTVVRKTMSLGGAGENSVASEHLGLAPLLSSTTRTEIKTRSDQVLMNLLRATSAFQSLTHDQLRKLKHSIVIVSFDDKETIIRDGEEGEYAYIVLRGGVVALVGGREVARIGLGGMFGERALIRNEPRAATIVAVGETDVAAIDKKSFTDAVSGSVMLSSQEWNNDDATRSLSSFAHVVADILGAGTDRHDVVAPPTAPPTTSTPSTTSSKDEITSSLYHAKGYESMLLDQRSFVRRLKQHQQQQQQPSSNSQDVVKSIRLAYLRVLSAFPPLVSGSMDDVFEKLVKALYEIMQVVKISVFLVDESASEGTELVLAVNREMRDRGLRLPVNNAGLVGVCYKERNIINMTDAYQDPRFRGQKYDEKTNFRTKQVMVVPLYETIMTATSGESKGVGDDDETKTQSNMLGIIQLINKRDDTPFSVSDVAVMQEVRRILGRSLSHIIHDTEDNGGGRGVSKWRGARNAKGRRSPIITVQSRSESFGRSSTALNVATLPSSVVFVLAVDNIMNLAVSRIKHRMGGSRKQHFRVRVQLRHGMVTIAEQSTKYTDVRVEKKEQVCTLQFENVVSILSRRASSGKLSRKSNKAAEIKAAALLANSRRNDGLDNHDGVVRFDVPLCRLPQAGYVRVLVERSLGTSDKKKAANSEILCWGDAPCFDFRNTLFGSSDISHIKIAMWKGSPSTKLADIMHVNNISAQLSANKATNNSGKREPAVAQIRLAIPAVLESIVRGDYDDTSTAGGGQGGRATVPRSVDPSLIQQHPEKTLNSSLRLIFKELSMDPYANARRDSHFMASGKRMQDSRLSSPEQISQLMQRCTAIDRLTDEDKSMLWLHRQTLATLGEEIINKSIGSSTLPAVLRAVDWTNPKHVEEIHHLLYRWDPQPSKIDALQLVGAQFADHKVRSLGVQCLEAMTDDELRLYMIQLIQAIKFEQHTDSALSRFLLRRSLAQPTTVGRAFFWGLKAEMLSMDGSSGGGDDGSSGTNEDETDVNSSSMSSSDPSKSPIKRKKSMFGKRGGGTGGGGSGGGEGGDMNGNGDVDENGETTYRAFASSEERRLKILMGFYIRNCGSHRITLGLQMFMMQRFQKVQERIKVFSVRLTNLFFFMILSLNI